MPHNLHLRLIAVTGLLLLLYLDLPPLIGREPPRVTAQFPYVVSGNGLMPLKEPWHSYDGVFRGEHRKKWGVVILGETCRLINNTAHDLGDKTSLSIRPKFRNSFVHLFLGNGGNESSCFGGHILEDRLSGASAVVRLFQLGTYISLLSDDDIYERRIVYRSNVDRDVHGWRMPQVSNSDVCTHLCDSIRFDNYRLTDSRTSIYPRTDLGLYSLLGDSVGLIGFRSKLGGLLNLSLKFGNGIPHAAIDAGGAVRKTFGSGSIPLRSDDELLCSTSLGISSRDKFFDLGRRGSIVLTRRNPLSNSANGNYGSNYQGDSFALLNGVKRLLLSLACGLVSLACFYGGFWLWVNFDSSNGLPARFGRTSCLTLGSGLVCAGIVFTRILAYIVHVSAAGVD